MSGSTLNVSELDFNNIKTNLKEFLRAQDQFTDYDFDGSAMSTLIDLLSYVTHYNAVNANFAINETFLDTAKIRSNVVSHAKLLGYTPRSASAAVANVDIQLNGLSDVGPVLMDRGTKFTTTIDDVDYTFVTSSSIEINASDNYLFSNVNLIEGTYKEINYTYDNASDTKFLIPDQNIVTSSMIVTVQESETISTIDTYTLAPNLTNIDQNSKIYFLNENKDGYYEISFGDGLIGYQPVNGNVITLNYIVTNGSEANGASQFTLAEPIDSLYDDVTITVNSKAAGGSEKEDIESIRYNAPLAFVRQNRAVTAEDYKNLILSEYGDVESIIVWGGELNDPPVYGKVYISLKPASTDLLSVEQQDYIKTSILANKNIISITPEFVDPDVTNLFFEVFFKYNPNITPYSADELESRVRETLSNYNDLQIKKFESVLRYSNLLKLIDETDVSILNSFIRIYMSKTLTPVLGARRRYEIYFSAPIYNTTSNESVISSSEFVFDNTSGCQLKDYLVSGERIIRVIKITDTGELLIKDSNAGIVDLITGSVILYNFSVSQEANIEIRVIPNSYDIISKRNQLLNILVDDAYIQGQVDTIATGGTTAGVDYETTPRHG